MSILPNIIDHGTEFERKQVEVIDDLLARKTDPDTAVKRLSSIIDDHKKDLIHSNKEGSETHSLIVFEPLVLGARKYPSLHHQLVATIGLITQLPDVLDDQEQPLELDGDILWHDLPGLYPTLREWLEGIDRAERSGPKRAEAISRFRNTHQFTALLYATGIPAFEPCNIFALWALRAALEGEELGNDRMSERWSADISIPPAALWIDVAGRRIFECQRKGLPDKSSAPFKGGRLWDGKHGFCRGRWDLWRSRFRYFATTQDVKMDEQTRAWAKKAEVTMGKIEAGIDSISP